MNSDLDEFLAIVGTEPGQLYYIQYTPWRGDYAGERKMFIPSEVYILFSDTQEALEIATKETSIPREWDRFMKKIMRGEELGEITLATHEPEEDTRHTGYFFYQDRLYRIAQDGEAIRSKHLFDERISTRGLHSMIDSEACDGGG
jgi:hypothetical protein